MSYDNFKIKESDISTLGVVAAPDRLTGTAQENKAVFDRLIKTVVAQKFNSFVDAVREEIDNIDLPAQGKSAYEIAVEKGFEGSEEEWLESLHSDVNAENIEAALGYRPGDADKVADKLEMHLVWTNAAYNSSFEAQTIALDLSEYDYVGIVAFFKRDASRRLPFWISQCPTTGGGFLSGVYASPGVTFSRTVTLTVNSVVFYDAYVTYPGTAGEVSNEYCIPYQVFGIKGVK